MKLNESLAVEKLFAGTNYLTSLATTSPGDLTLSTGFESRGHMITGVPESIFNKFSLFSYSKFIAGSNYSPEGHFIGFSSKNKSDIENARANSARQDDIINTNTSILNSLSAFDDNSMGSDGGQSPFANLSKRLSGQVDNAVASKAQSDRASEFAIRNRSVIANPTAANIIQWSKDSDRTSVVGFQPYSMTDFIFCKNYGKIPNNRLITLRRYPYPIDDSLRLSGKNQAIPTEQAVTWWGEGSDNSLAKIGVLKWGLLWKKVDAISGEDGQTITGNEVTITELADIFKKIPGYEGLASKLLVAGAVGLGGSNAQLQQVTGQEKKMQDYMTALYTAEGPYWNRVYGPVNVIHESTQRARGMQQGWEEPFVLNFHYSFRSFNGLSPKIVALDLISSFLNLTYNDAQFLGQLARYFPKIGVKFSPAVTEALGRILTSFGTTFGSNNAADILKITTEFTNATKAATDKALSVAKNVANGNTADVTGAAGQVAQAGAMTLLSEAIPKLIAVRSALSDRPVGEWHIVVGNPMNPIMVMGDLLCTDCSMTFDEEMGPDDFPTGIKFAVTLKQGKPRDKVAIERMFNLGDSKMMTSVLRSKASAEDTFGDVNNDKWSQISNGVTEEDINKLRSNTSAPANATPTQKKNIEFDNANKARHVSDFGSYRNRIRSAYGYSPASDANGKSANANGFDDSLLWLYFDNAQDRK